MSTISSAKKKLDWLFASKTYSLFSPTIWNTNNDLSVRRKENLEYLRHYTGKCPLYSEVF